MEQLSRLSLREGLTREASVHEAEDHSTPDSLMNSYMVVKLEEKINVLYSFLKTHMTQKIIVFMATCRQVAFFFFPFPQVCRIPTDYYSLYFVIRWSSCSRRFVICVPAYRWCCSMVSWTRWSVCPSTRNFPASRGLSSSPRTLRLVDSVCYSLLNLSAVCKVREKLMIHWTMCLANYCSDFPKVDWVVQYDCPEDADEYIHRAGRTARLNRRGYSLLFLLPNEEEPMLKRMAIKRIPVKKTQWVLRYPQQKEEILRGFFSRIHSTLYSA